MSQLEKHLYSIDNIRRDAASLLLNKDEQDALDFCIGMLKQAIAQNTEGDQNAEVP